MMGDAQYRAWGNLADTVQTGDNAYEKIFGKPIFDHLAEQPEKARIFDDAMTGIHGREIYRVDDTWENADRMTPVLDKQFEDWKHRRDRKPWWRFW